MWLFTLSSVNYDLETDILSALSDRAQVTVGSVYVAGAYFSRNLLRYAGIAAFMDTCSSLAADKLRLTPPSLQQCAKYSG